MLERHKGESQRLPEGSREGNNPLLAIDIILAKNSHTVLSSARQDVRSLQKSLKLELDWRKPNTLRGQGGDLEAALEVFNPAYRAFPIPIDIAKRFRWGDEETDDLLRDFGIDEGFVALQSRKDALARSTNPNIYRRIQGVPTVIPGITLTLSYGVNEPRWYLTAEINHAGAILTTISSDLPELPSGEYMKHALMNYYESIDRGDLESVLRLFSNDEEGEPTVRYKRGTQPEKIGIRQLRYFFEVERFIKEGKHTLRDLVVDDRTGTGKVVGRFEGTLKDGSDADIEFIDRFEFLAGKIIYRRSTFPGQEV